MHMLLVVRSCTQSLGKAMYELEAGPRIRGVRSLACSSGHFFLSTNKVD